MPAVVGSPVQAFVDGVRTVLTADATLTALVSGVFGHVPEAARTDYPYLVIGRRTRDNSSGAMQKAGGMVTIELDGWSAHNGPSEIAAILSRVAVLLERQAVTVTGYAFLDGSLTCEFEEIFDEPDGDTPDQRLYHGVQRWTAEIHEA